MAIDDETLYQERLSQADELMASMYLQGASDVPAVLRALGDQSLYDREYPVAVLTYTPTNLPETPRVGDTFKARIMLSGRVNENALIISDTMESIDEDVIHDLHVFSNILASPVRDLAYRG